MPFPGPVLAQEAETLRMQLAVDARAGWLAAMTGTDQAAPLTSVRRLGWVEEGNGTPFMW